VEMALPWVESPSLEAHLAAKQPAPEWAAMARHYHREGFLVLEDVVLEALAQRIIAEVAPLYDAHAPEGPRSRYRVQDAWANVPAVRELATHPRILEVLAFLYGRDPVPFQTLNFCYGSQQAGHADQFHFSSLPPRFMCGVWVALEDVTAENGPLFYYPGSHRLPEYDYSDLSRTPEEGSYPDYERFVAALMRAQRIEPRRLLVREGSALVWSSNIVHGGTRIASPGRTRHSQVTHYFFADCVYYTPMHSNRALGEFALREETIDLRTGRPAVQTYNGRPFRIVDLQSGRKALSLGRADRAAHAEEELRRILDSRAYRVGRLVAEPYWRLREVLVRARRESRPAW